MRRLAAALLLLAACSRAPEPPKGMTVYEAKSGEFSVWAPSDWKVLEDQGGAQRATFFSATGESIGIYRYEKGGEQGDARQYAAAQSLSGKAGPLLESSVGDKPALEFIVERDGLSLHGALREKLRVRTVIFEDPKGFWALVDTVPMGKEPSVDAFDTVLRSFKPK